MLCVMWYKVFVFAHELGLCSGCSIAVFVQARAEGSTLLTYGTWSHMNVEHVRFHLEPKRTPPPPTLPWYQIRAPYMLGAGGLECILLCVMWLFAEKWVDLALQCHTHMHTLVHTLASAKLEVFETDLLSAGGLGPLHHFLQTENRGSSQLKPGWGNNGLSSCHWDLVSGMIPNRFLFLLCKVQIKEMKRFFVRFDANKC